MIVENGIAALDESPRTSAYLSLFGGNLEDNGTDATKAKSWWANFAETDPDRHIRSRTQAILIGLPAISSNLTRVEEAAEADLAWFETAGIASSISVTATLPKRNTVRLLIQITGSQGSQWTFDFSAPWGPQPLN